MTTRFEGLPLLAAGCAHHGWKSRFIFDSPLTNQQFGEIAFFVRAGNSERHSIDIERLSKITI